MHPRTQHLTAALRQVAWRPLAWALVLPLLWSCSSSPVFEGGDGAPDRVVDVSKIPDAVPRVEPLSAYGNPRQYTVAGHSYRVRSSSAGYMARGIASWYGTKFHGRRTSSGEPYDMYAMTAAHRTLPLPTFVRVTNLDNGRSVIVKVNDRGPFVKNRLIDLSYVAAKKLGVIATGTAPVEVRAIDPRQHQEAHATPIATTESVSSSAPPGSQPRLIPAVAHDSRIYVQVGAFSDRQNAERLRNRLARMPIRPIEIQQATSKQRLIYRVRVGPLDSVSDADRMSDVLAKHGLASAHIVVD